MKANTDRSGSFRNLVCKKTKSTTVGATRSTTVTSPIDDDALITDTTALSALDGATTKTVAKVVVRALNRVLHRNLKAAVTKVVSLAKSIVVVANMNQILV